MPQPVLRTERLLLEPLADVHLPHEVALDADAEVMRYLEPSGRTPEQVAAAHERRLAAGREVDGLGLWAGFLRADRTEFVGLSFVRAFHEPFDDPVEGIEHGEVEYSLTRDEWLTREAPRPVQPSG